MANARALLLLDYYNYAAASSSKMNLFLTLGLSALLALCFGGGAGVQSEFTPVCWLHFRAAVRAGREPGTTDLHIIFSLEEEDICRDTHLV